MPSICLPARGAHLALGGIAVLLVFVQFVPLFTGGYEHEVAFLATHTGATAAIALIAIGLTERRKIDDVIPIYDLLLIAAVLTSAGYFVLQGERIAERIEGVDDVLTLDCAFGILLIIVLLEACRRVAGLVLTCVATIFIIYVFMGPYLPGALSHRGLSFERFIDLQVLSTSAIFGTPISASAHMVFYFVIVGAFLERSGAGKLFVDLAHGLTARSWGGAGKAAVVASGLIGTVSGSAVANVLLSGIMTIPLMRRSGFSRRFASAIEATASTGGQLAPPIMGAAAFVLADIVGVRYTEVIYAALVPALLYYTSLFMLVHFYSLRKGLKPNDSILMAEHISGLKDRWHLLLPLAVMIYLLISRFSLMTVGAYTTLLILAVSAIRPATRMKLTAIYEAICNGARSAAEVAVPSAIAGIVVGTLVQTGMALKLQRWLLDLAGNSLVISLLGAMLLTIILGMGMPTTAAYLVSAILVAPALQELGVAPLAAHLFILYFGILSMVTPPVALSAYAAAGISGSNLWNTGLLAFVLAVPGFLIPYSFAINPALLMQGPLNESIVVIISGFAGVIGLAAASGGYAFGPLSIPLRAVMFISAPLLIVPDGITDFVGLASLIIICFYQVWRYKLRSFRSE